MQSWDWAAIEAIASVVGGVGVVISIIFLIYEVRHYARAIEGATVQSLISLAHEVFSLMADNTELITKAGLDPDAPTEAELYRYERGADTCISPICSACVQHKRDLIEDEVWAACVNALSRHIATPGVAAAWSRIKLGDPESFQTAIAPHFSLSIPEKG